MRRAILLLATFGLALSGCSRRNDPGSLTFYWSFQDAGGAIAGDFTVRNPGCDIAGVDSVDITVGGVTSTENCVQSNGAPGVTITGFLQGPIQYGVDGFRGNERVFTTSGVVNARSNADVSTDLTLTPIDPQSLVVDFNVLNTTGTTSTQCVFNGQPIVGLLYELQDASGNIVSSTDVPGSGGTVKQPINCDPNTFGFSIAGVPLGNYRLRYLTAVSAVGGVVQVCSQPIFHGGFPAVVQLMTALSTCP
jgi:hypothetical protein